MFIIFSELANDNSYFTDYIHVIKQHSANKLTCIPFLQQSVVTVIKFKLRLLWTE